MNNNKIKYIKEEVLSNVKGVRIVTDKAILRVIENYEQNLSSADIDKLNKSLVIPIHRRTANMILNASKQFDRMIIKDILLIA